jgi:hypothetical protein
MPVSFLMGIAGELPEALAWVNLCLTFLIYRFQNAFVQRELRILDYEM